MNKKVKLILSIVLGAVAFVGLVFLIIFITKPFEPKSDGTISVIVEDINGNVLTQKDIEFFEGDTIDKLLTSNFENVVIKDGMIMSIDALTTPSDWKTFICIYVDGEMSPVGLLEIEFCDGTEIKFVDTEMTWE